MLFCRKKFPVHVVISILQAFNCRCLEIFVHDIYFFSLYFKAKIQWNKGMSDFDSGNSVLLDVNLYETKKNNWSPIPSVFTVCLSRRSYWFLRELLRPLILREIHANIRIRAVLIFCNPSQQGTKLYFVTHLNVLL